MIREKDRKQIIEFCRGCDFLNKRDKSCIQVGGNQLMVTKRGLCDSAMVNGARGTMTSNGFIPEI